MFSKKFTAEPT
jgi:hypothetical protein